MQEISMVCFSQTPQPYSHVRVLVTRYGSSRCPLTVGSLGGSFLIVIEKSFDIRI